jgi:hypothetical protein
MSVKKLNDHQTVNIGAIRSESRSIPWDTIHVDQMYQRMLDENFSKSIALNFDNESIGIIHVSCRQDGTYWVVDGQHRLAALRMLGEISKAERGRDTWAGVNVECRVYYGLSIEAEARLFGLLNRTRNVTAYDKFRAANVAGDEVCRGVSDICGRLGIRIGRNPSNWTVTCVKAMQTVYADGTKRKNLFGKEQLLERTLRIISRAWDGDQKGFSQNIIKGTSRILTKFWDRIDEARLIHVMSNYPNGPASMEADASGITGKSATFHKVAYLIIDQYDAGLRKNRLRGADEI